MANTLRFELFGSLRIRRGDAPLSLPTSKRARSLLAYLALHVERTHGRDALCGLFWPDLSETASRRQLSQALWHLRRALSGTEMMLVNQGDELKLCSDTPLWRDVTAFEDLLIRGTASRDAQMLEAAVKLYRGEFLAGLYDEWLLAAREQYLNLYLGTLEQLWQLYAARGEYEAAHRHARAALRADSLHEGAHRELMRLHLLAGRPAEALRQFRHHAKLLHEELGVAPALETARLHEQIRAAQGEPSRPTAPLLAAGESRLPLIGREAERAALQSAVLSASPLVRAALLGGEAGVGKTRLLRELVQDARWRGVEVCWGSAGEFGASPFGLLRAAFGETVAPHVARAAGEYLGEVWRREAARVLPGLLPDGAGGVGSAPLEAQHQAERLREALTRAVLALGQVAPHLIV